MKTLKHIATAVFAVLLSVNSFAQMKDHSKTAATKIETIKVYGNCDQCKTRIEKAAKITGVGKADWNSDTKLLTLTYDPSKVKSDDVQKKIVAVGHDTEKFKADKKTYDALPGCCKYR
jgi:mercuric ion binding protein